jgi:hypothetical protein
MTFLNIPIKSVEGTIVSVIGTETMPWYNPTNYPVIPPNLPLPPVQLNYRWRVVMSITAQTQSSYLTRAPGQYTGMDVNVGEWIGNLTSGQAWQIISVESKTDSSITIIVEDIFRYNTFRDPSGTGAGAPNSGTYVIFDIDDTGIPQIDPLPPSGASASFAINIQSRFQYINQQYDYPLYQSGNTFVVNDVIAADASTNSFVLSDAANKIVVGRVTSVSNTIPGWFTVNPVQKIVDFLDYLPGDVADVIYTSTAIPGAVTDVPGGSQLYIKLRNNTSSVSNATAAGGTASGNTFQLNGVDVQVLGAGTANDLLTAANLVSTQTGVVTTLALVSTSVETSVPLITVVYGEPALWATSSPAVATINGVSVTFNIPSTDPGYEDYARPQQMAQSINNATIPNIVASNPGPSILRITNVAGGAINIVNITSDINGVPVAGSNSGTGLALSTPASSTYRLRFTADDARAINFLNVIGDPVGDFGLVSVENGVKACGLYIQSGLRTASTVVVANLTALNALTPYIGDQAYVIDSDDGQGNNVGMWSMWLYDGTIWVETSNQDSATTDAKSLEYTLTTVSPGTINIGEISTGRRVTLITIEVATPFDGSATVEIGYQVNNPVPPPPVPAGLMAIGLTDLTVTGTYTTYTDILFGTDTVQGDVTITATFANGGSTVGSAQIIVSYV